MAEAAQDADVDNANTGAEKRKPVWLKLVAVFVVLLAAGGGGAWYLLAPGHGEHMRSAAADNPHDPIYLALEPAMVVNFKEGGAARFLQVSLQVMARDPEVIAAVERYQPSVRNNLVLLFSNQSSQDIATREGKERLRQAALEEVNEVIASQSGEDRVEAVYFTNFVMQ